MEHLDKIADEKRKLLFALQSQATPNVICITLNQYQDQKDLMDWFKTAFSDQQHFVLDLTAEKVESLFPKLLAFSLDNKENIKPLDLVHVIGLENSVSHFVENHAVDLPLIANMNYDRENFFKRLPFHTVLWGNAYFFKQLHRNAPDFMHWVTLKFDFSRPLEHLENIQPLINHSPKQLGKIPERKQVIKDLEAQYANLNLDASDTKRLFKDKLTLLEALGSEHYKQQEYAVAKDYLEKALSFAEKINNPEDVASVQFQLGDVFLGLNLLDESLASFQLAKNYCEKFLLNNLGACYHRIGIVYERQRLWEEAIEQYQQAIVWFEKTGNHFELGGSFHQIGRAYEKQNSYDQAQKYYHLAIENFNVHKHPDLKKAEESLQRVNKLLAANKQA